MPEHPMPNGTRVRHISQEYPRAFSKGTGNIVAAKGPYSDGAYEYLVRTHDITLAPESDSPETVETWWASYATAPVNTTEQ